MVLAGIPSSISGIVGLTAGSDTALGNPTVNAPPDSASADGSSGGGPSASLHAILAQYDVHHISPSDFSRMVQQLQDSHAIGDGDVRMLSQIRTALDESGANPDDPLDLVAFLQERLSDQQQKFVAAVGQGPKSSAAQGALGDLKTLQTQLDWIQKFSTVQSSSGSQPLNTLA